MSNYVLVFSCIHIWNLFLIAYFLLNISGKSCQLFNNLNPDWVPTVNLGHDKIFQSPLLSTLDIHETLTGLFEEKTEWSSLGFTPTTRHWQYQHIICRTGRRDWNMFTNWCGHEFNRIYGKWNSTSPWRKQQIEKYMQWNCLFDNNEKVKYYTGQPKYNVLMAVIRLLEHHVLITDRSSGKGKW